MENNLILESSLLDAIRGAKLFYPCSGMDLFDPIDLFSGYIDDFWFVDRGYFCPGHQDTRHYGYDAPADEQPPLLKGKGDYLFIERAIRGPAVWGRNNGDIEPCLSTEKYLHKPTNRHIYIRRRRGYGYSAFRTEKEISPLGIFFYRGDSIGEGGSGNLWLAPDHLAEICSKIIDGGLIVTDGSGSWRRNIRRRWCCHKTGRAMSPEEMISAARPFAGFGCRFTCRGYVGQRYGPTLVWQVRKS